MFYRLLERLKTPNLDLLPRPHRGYIIDWLRPCDLPQIARLERAFFPEPLSIIQLARLQFEPNTYYIVARKRRRLAGYIGFQKFGPTAQTISMAVHPDHHRQGLATALQLTANQTAANRGARWFTGQVRVSNAQQLQFLEKLGWQRIGVCSRFFRNGEDAVVVWTWL